MEIKIMVMVAKRDGEVIVVVYAADATDAASVVDAAGAAGVTSLAKAPTVCCIII